jgi:hypothetical protein
MKLVKTVDSYEVYQKRSGRYAVKKDKKYVNGEEKIQVLSGQGLIQPPKKKAPAPEPEAPAEGGEEAAAE